MPIDDTYIKRFQQDGYVVIPDLLTGDELNLFQQITRGAVAKRKRFDTREVKDKSAYEQSFIQCMNLWEDFPDIRPLTFHPRITRAAAQLIGAPAIRLWHDQALFKESGGRITDPHQDHPYWPMVETDAVTAWIPFDGTTLQSGCMGYIKGSHLTGKRRFVNIFKAGEEDLAAQAGDLLDGEMIFVEVPRGSVAFHHALTMHEAKPNQTGKTREVHTMIFFRDGNTRAQKGRHYSVDRAGIKPGHPINSSATPIAWPLANGTLPEPPPPLEDLAEIAVRSGAFPQSDQSWTTGSRYPDPP